MPPPIPSFETRSTYLKRDLTTLGIIVAVIVMVIGVAWYAEQRGGGFSAAARSLLDFFTK